MNRRHLVALCAACTLFAAACGDDGDNGDSAADTTTTTEAMEEETTDEVAMGPAELVVEDQSGDGTTVVVASVTLPSDGFIAVHADGGGSPGPVIGHSELLAAGESTEVEVVLDEPLTADATVFPMAHIDTNGNGTYDFDPPDVTDDGPALLDDESVAVLPLAYTVAGGDASGGAEEAATISGFTFQPDPIEVAAGTTVVWTNEDGAGHTVTAEDGSFSEPVDPGASASVTFDSAGEYEYFCGVHPEMTGTVVVS